MCFLLHFPRSYLHRELPGILPYGARTFLPTTCVIRRLSAPRAQAQRFHTPCSSAQAASGMGPLIEQARPVRCPFRGRGSRTQTENDEPQPQDPVTFGLPNLKPEPCTPST